MYEDEGWLPAGSDDGQGNDRLAGSGRSRQGSEFPVYYGLQSRLLIIFELAVELDTRLPAKLAADR